MHLLKVSIQRIWDFSYFCYFSMHIISLYTIFLWFAMPIHTHAQSLHVFPAPIGATLYTDFKVCTKQGSGNWQQVAVYQAEVNLDNKRNASWSISILKVG